MKALKSGDTCRVRLHTGEVFDAVYEMLSVPELRYHWVRYNDSILIAVSRRIIFEWEFRFVGPACDMVPMGVSK